MSFSDLLNSFWLFLTTSSWAIPLTFSAYILQKFFVPQILDFRKTLERARYDIIYYGNVFPIVVKGEILNMEELTATSKELRVMSAKLRSTRDSIPLYKFIAKLNIIPEWNISEDVAFGFMGWSNEIMSVNDKIGRHDYREKIAKALNMKSY